MKEIYDWVPWFEELGKKIAEGGEQYLANNAKMVAWKDDDTESALLKYGESNIDPMSFFYTLASQSKNNKSRNRIYPSITKIFGMPSTLDVNSDEMFKFPTPPGSILFFTKTVTAIHRCFGDCSGMPYRDLTLFSPKISKTHSKYLMSRHRN